MAKKLLAALVIASASITIAHAEVPATESESGVHHGVASFYAHYFEGRRTASGETFRHAALTAAHRSLPFGTLAIITNLRTGKQVIVRITDRIYSGRALIDLTRAAAAELDMLQAGRARVSLRVLEPPQQGASLQQAVEVR